MRFSSIPQKNLAFGQLDKLGHSDLRGSRIVSMTHYRYYLNIVMLFIACIVAIGLVAAVSAETIVSGRIQHNTTWTAQLQPYLVTGDVIVDSDTTLTIEPGVTVRFSSGTGLIVRKGALVAVGTSSKKIVFTSYTDIVAANPPPAPGNWGALKFETGTVDVSTVLDYVDVHYGKGVMVESAAPTFRNINFRYNAGPAISIDLTSSPVGQGLTATDNLLNGIWVPAGDITSSIVWGLVGIPYVVEEGVVSIGTAPIALTPASTRVATGVVVVYTVTLNEPAPAGGVSVDIVSSVPTVASVPASVHIVAGERSAQFSLTGANLGYTTLTVSKPGLGDATAGLRVEAPPTLKVTPDNLVLGLNKTRTLTVTLSQPAPMGGINLAITNSDSTIISAPATLPVASGASTVDFDITTLSAGNANLTVQAIGYSSAKATIAVRPIALNVPATMIVAPGATTSIPIQLTEPAPIGGLLITLKTVNSGIATVNTSITVPEGASTVNAVVSGVSVGTTALTATAPGYSSGTGNVVVDSIAIGFNWTGNISIPKGLPRELIVRLNKPAPAGGVSITVAVADSTIVSVLPVTVVTVAEGQTTAMQSITLKGLTEGSTTLTATSLGLIAVSSTITVTAPVQLVFYQWRSPAVVGKGLTLLHTSYYTVERRLKGNAFSGPDPVVINLTSSDPSKVTVPATVTIPANASSVAIPLSGVDITASDVTITATANGYEAPAQAFMVKVEMPELQFSSLDSDRSVANARDDFYVRWYVGGNPVVSLQSAMVDQMVALTVVDASPAGIIAGVYDAATAGSVISTVQIKAGQSTSHVTNNRPHYVGVPTQSGTYRIGASVTGMGSWSSAVQTVSAPQLVFYQWRSPAVVGKGLTLLHTSYYTVERRLKGNAFSGPDPVVINLTSSDPSKVTVPATVTIPANASSVAIPLSGVDITASDVTITATANGYEAPAQAFMVKVEMPELQFSSLDSDRSVANARDDFYVRWYVGGNPVASLQSAMVDQMVALTVVDASPAGIIAGVYDAATAGSVISTVQIKAGQSTSHATNNRPHYVGVPTQSGTYRIGASVTGMGSWSSAVQTVSAPQLVFYQWQSPAVVGKGLTLLHTSYYTVERRLKGNAFRGLDPVVINLTSSDPSKVTVPATVTIPANASSVAIPLSGVDITASDVTITATANGYEAPAQAFMVKVEMPELQFSGLDSDRSVANARDDFYVKWYVGGNPVASLQSAMVDQMVALTVVEASPAGIVAGVYDAATAGSVISTVQIKAGQSTSHATNNRSHYVGVPTQSGTYRIGASVTGMGSWSSAVQTVSAPQLVFYQWRSPAVVGKGLTLHTSYYMVERRLKGNAFSGPDPVVINLTCASTAICTVPSTVTIPANQSSATIPITGIGIGTTQIAAIATGYLPADGFEVKVVEPTFTFTNLPTTLATNAIQQVWVRTDVPENPVARSQAAAVQLTLNLVSSVPSVASITASVLIAAGSSQSATAATLKGASAGSMSITVSAPGFTPLTSAPLTITP